MIIKTVSITLLAGAGALVLQPSPAVSGTAPTVQGKVAKVERSDKEFAVDATHSCVVFRVMHLNASAFWGRFNTVSGSFKIDDKSLDSSFVKVEIDAASVDSNSERRDRHLKAQDFFNVKEHPKLTFESTKIEAAEAKEGGGARYKVTGDLTMRGVKKTVVAWAEHTGTANMSPRFGLRSGYEATLEIKRTEFGMDYMAKGDALSDKVRVIIALEGKLP